MPGEEIPQGHANPGTFEKQDTGHKMKPYFEYHPQHAVLIPTISLVTGECECCGETGGLLIALDFGFWSMGCLFPGGGRGHE